MLLFVRHNFTFSRYSFFEFLADVAGRLLRHAASFEKDDRECQTDRAKTSHPGQTRELDIFLQSFLIAATSRCSTGSSIDASLFFNL